MNSVGTLLLNEYLSNAHKQNRKKPLRKIVIQTELKKIVFTQFNLLLILHTTGVVEIFNIFHPYEIVLRRQNFE